MYFVPAAGRFLRMGGLCRANKRICDIALAL